MQNFSDQLKAKLSQSHPFKNSSPHSSHQDSSLLIEKFYKGNSSSKVSDSESPSSQKQVKVNPFKAQNGGISFMPGQRTISPAQTEPDHETLNTSVDNKSVRSTNLDKSFMMKGKIKISPPRTVASSTTVVVPVNHIKIKQGNSKSPEIRISEQLQQNQKLSMRANQHKDQCSVGFKRKVLSKKASGDTLSKDETTVLSDEEEDHIGPLGGAKQKKNNLGRVTDGEGEGKIWKQQDEKNGGRAFKKISLSKIKNSPSPSPPSHQIIEKPKSQQLAQDFIKGMINKGKNKEGGQMKRFGVDLQNIQANQPKQQPVKGSSLYMNYIKDTNKRSSDNKENIESNFIQFGGKPQQTTLSRREEGIKQQGKHLPQNHSPFNQSPGEQNEITLKQQNENQYMKKISSQKEVEEVDKQKSIKKEPGMFKFPFQRRARKDCNQSQDEEEQDLSQIVAQKLRLQYKSNSPPHSTPFNIEDQKRNKPIVAKTNFVMAHKGLVNGVEQQCENEIEEVDQNQEVDEWLMLPGGSQETADSQKLKEPRKEKGRRAEGDLDDWMFKTFDPSKKERESSLPPTLPQQEGVGGLGSRRGEDPGGVEESPFGLAPEVIERREGQKKERDKSMCDEISSFINEIDSLIDVDPC